MLRAKASIRPSQQGYCRVQSSLTYLRRMYPGFSRSTGHRYQHQRHLSRSRLPSAARPRRCTETCKLSGLRPVWISSLSSPSTANCNSYDTAVSREAIRAMPGFTPCPDAECSGGHFHETPEAEPIFTCEVCRTKYCVVCNVPWHTGQTCVEYQEFLNTAGLRKEQEEQSAAYIEKTTKKCPGENCAWNIEKNNGCDHMTCESINWRAGLGLWKLIILQVGSASTSSAGNASPLGFQSLLVVAAMPFITRIANTTLQIPQNHRYPKPPLKLKRPSLMSRTMRVILETKMNMTKNTCSPIGYPKVHQPHFKTNSEGNAQLLELFDRDLCQTPPV